MKTSIRITGVLITALVGWASAAFAVEAASTSLGVLPFEAKGAPGRAVPDVARLLADRLATRGLAKVVGPTEWKGAVAAEIEAEALRAWATEQELQAIVLGRTTRIGDQLSIDVSLRSGTTGAAARSLVQQVPDAALLGNAVDELATQVIDAALDLLGGPAPAAAQSSPAKRAAASKGDGKTPFGFSGWDSSQPMSIESSELSADQVGNRRRLVFQGNVRVEQANLTIRCKRLEAFYPPDGSQPHQLECRGDVTIQQGKQEARCDSARYDRNEERLVCSGNATFEEGGNQLRGNAIDIDLARETMRVTGGAQVVIQPKGSAGSKP